MSALILPAFNSIKVRLKRVLVLLPSVEVASFNSIKVRLKLRWLFAQHNFYGPFNSIKVRLKPLSTRQIQTLFAFQFHKGAIETGGERADAVFIVLSIP